MQDTESGQNLKNKKPNNFVEGFTTSKGLMLDLDNTSLKETKSISEHYCKRFKLEGYLILRSSPNNYHVVFNRYLSWRKTTEYLAKIQWRHMYHRHGDKPHLIFWITLQLCKGSETLRISSKKHKHKPHVVLFYGKTDKLINDYMQYYDTGDK